MAKFDLIIIGGGAAGFAAAIKADELGTKTLMVNSGLPMGGTCVNVGCVPTKFLLEVAGDYYKINHRRFYSLSSFGKIDFTKLMREKDELVNSLRKSNYEDVLKNLPNVVYRDGKGHFISDDEIKLNGLPVSRHGERFSASKFIITTGSSTKVISIEGLKETEFLTNRTVLELKKLPESLLVIGAGPIGLEFGQIFSRLGSNVTIVELMEQILPQAEPIISEELRKSMEEEGINIITGAKTKKLENKNGKKIVLIEKEGKSEGLEAEDVLLATGVVGNSKDLGLDKIGIEVDKNGFIKVNEYLQTTKPHIYAAGDIIGAPWLETIAAKEGNIAVQNAFKDSKIEMSFANIPYAVFTSPQVASVGMKEAEYMQKYGTCLCSMVKMDRVPKAKAIKDTRGLIFMVLDHKTKRILGVHIVSSIASEIIHEATLAVRSGLTIDDIIDTVHVFPTFSEAVKIVAQSFRHDAKRMSCCVE
ncbi:MAG: mercury(II) reductase [Candidatus Omnitrophica bacterium]|nr:mercury(II) reductase [Candidatus Omnitrophota bacterium]